MPNRAVLLIAAALSWSLALPLAARGASGVRVRIDGPIMPPVAEQFTRALDRAEKEAAPFVLVEIDTPGGRSDAMEQIVARSLNARVPVVAYVTPAGARAASAGAIIGLAANVLAMNPTTHIGAAHPVDGNGNDIARDMRAKVENDAAALARSIAAKRGRDAATCEAIVRRSISLTADEAVKRRVADMVAANEAELLHALDGRKVDTGAGPTVIHAQGANLSDEPLTARERFLLFLFDPNVAVILGTIAMLGIITELSHPGAIVPGVAGGIALLLNLYVMSALSANVAGMALLALAALLFGAELYTPSHGALSVGGLVSFVIGCLLLFRGSPLGVQVSPILIAVMTALLGGALAVLVTAVVRTRRKPLDTGPESLVGKPAFARSDFETAGRVFVDGAIWNAVNVGAEPIRNRDRVVVEARDGLTLKVRRAVSAR